MGVMRRLRCASGCALVALRQGEQPAVHTQNSTREVARYAIIPQRSINSSRACPQRLVARSAHRSLPGIAASGVGYQVGRILASAYSAAECMLIARLQSQ